MDGADHSRVTDDIVLDQIRGDVIGEAWPHMEPWFISACRAVATSLTPDLILYRATARQYDLWAIYDKHHPLPLLGAAATALREVNGETIAHIEAIAGRDANRWMRPALDEYEALARKNGISRIEIEGRLGWQRRLPGYKPVRIVMTKVL